ncbi:MAG TPA: hypothetical protein VII65_00010 [Acidimicrobiales bacterium]
MAKLPTPKAIGKSGAALWVQITTAIEFEDPREIHALRQACLLEDDVARLRDELEQSELIVQGSTGQPVENPLLGAIRNATALQAKLLASIAVERDEVERSSAGRRLVSQRYI